MCTVRTSNLVCTNYLTDISKQTIASLPFRSFKKLKREEKPKNACTKHTDLSKQTITPVPFRSFKKLKKREKPKNARTKHTLNCPHNTFYCLWSKKDEEQILLCFVLQSLMTLNSQYILTNMVNSKIFFFSKRSNKHFY